MYRCQPAHEPILQPLPARVRQAAGFLLACRQFSADTLLIAADAFEEASRQLAWDRMFPASDEAAELARQLRATAPARARSGARHA